MFKWTDVPEGTIYHDGAMLHLAVLRLRVAVREAFGIRRFERWLADR